GRKVAAGEGVLASAVLGDDARELAGREPLRPLEHHVLEDVRDAGGTVLLVAAADLVPYLRDDDRRAMVPLDDELQAVVEQVFAGPGRRVGRLCAVRGERDGRQAVQGERGSEEKWPHA